jgi:hypothetical protein
MMALWYRFTTAPDEATWRALLRAEVGRLRSGPRAVELDWSPPAIGAESGMLTILSMDLISLAYSAKVTEAMGGLRVEGSPQNALF